MLEGENPLSIKIGEKLCRMESANFTMTTKLIDGNYPNYRKVIPQDFSATVEINAAQLRAKIETVGLALPDMSGCVTLTFADNKLTLNASSTEVGEGCDMVFAYINWNWTEQPACAGDFAAKLALRKIKNMLPAVNHQFTIEQRRGISSEKVSFVL